MTAPTQKVTRVVGACAQLDALDAELHDAETYLKLADTPEGFLGRLADGLDQLEIAEQQRILRLVVREVLIGGDDDTITIRHSIPTTRLRSPIARPVVLTPPSNRRHCATESTRWLVLDCA